MATDLRSTGTANSEDSLEPIYAPVTGWTTTGDAVRLVPTHCPFCGMQCGMNLKVDNAGHVFGVEPRNFPVNKGRLCPKGVVAYQQINHPQRLTYPMMRRGGKDSPLERCTWDEALDRIVTTFRAIQAEDGPNLSLIHI